MIAVSVSVSPVSFDFPRIAVSPLHSLKETTRNEFKQEQRYEVHPQKDSNRVKRENGKQNTIEMKERRKKRSVYTCMEGGEGVGGGQLFVEVTRVGPFLRRSLLTTAAIFTG
jgi:hypothetical protein